MARPKKDIDPEKVEGMAQIGATNCEIAQILGCSEATIRGRFCEQITKGRSLRRTKLRKRQFELAIEGNVTMLIWLGKQELQQTDRVENLNINHDTNDIEVAREKLESTETGRKILRVIEERGGDAEEPSAERSA